MEFFNLHTHTFSNNLDIIEIVNQYPKEFINNNKPFSIGIHPWKVVDNDIEAEMVIINNQANYPSCLAIGECGLDKRVTVDFDLQTQVFQKHLLIAQRINKPVIVHCVGAFQELIAIKNDLKIDVPIIIHGFSKNKALAKQLIKEGFYLSFGKYLMLNPDLEETFLTIPNERFFLETDSSNYKIQEIYHKAAFYKKCTLVELKQIINYNFQKVF